MATYHRSYQKIQMIILRQKLKGGEKMQRQNVSVNIIAVQRDREEIAMALESVKGELKR